MSASRDSRWASLIDRVRNIVRGPYWRSALARDGVEPDDVEHAVYALALTSKPYLLDQRGLVPTVVRDVIVGERRKRKREVLIGGDVIAEVITTTVPGPDAIVAAWAEERESERALRVVHELTRARTLSAGSRVALRAALAGEMLTTTAGREQCAVSTVMRHRDRAVAAVREAVV